MTGFGNGFGNGLGNLVQKAFYLGVGAASLAAEKASGKLVELRVQAQKLADEMVARGEITTEDAKRMVDDMISRAQQEMPLASETQPSQPQTIEPRRIEIIADDEPESQTNPTASTPSDDAPADDLRAQVAKLQEELRRLKQE
ncbi:phasin family protein [Leptolyngbya ohadii]|uniref:phasin family protein n=1 Tax=Leptolyngbya ohadii TaxID=1962290 RepID=UPI000B59B8D4|nr:hypothetical protein [Leptolyngbya ohadii]